MKCVNIKVSFLITNSIVQNTITKRGTFYFLQYVNVYITMLGGHKKDLHIMWNKMK